MPAHSCGWLRGLFLVGMAILPVTEMVGGPLVIAHRGASKVAPENTRSALMAAVEQKAPVIEFDVRETTDGKLVLFHDASLTRVAGKDGSVESSRWIDLEDLDVGKWFGDGKFSGEKPILLREAIQICADHDIVALVEHKSGDPENYAKVIREFENSGQVIVQSFQWSFLKAFQEKMPEIPLGALGSKELSGAKFDSIQGLKPKWVGWNHSDLKEADLVRLQKSGFQVALWTVNQLEDAEKWIERGVDAIITDVPNLMLERISSKSTAP